MGSFMYNQGLHLDKHQKDHLVNMTSQFGLISWDWNGLFD
jgi:hypothetical protein